MEEFDLDNMEEDPFALRERVVETSAGAATISYVVCVPLEEAGFVNAFSTRRGGVSPLPDGALNLSNFKGDREANVEENRRRFLEAIGAPEATIITSRQTHSAERCAIRSLDQASGAQNECDAMTTRLANALLAIQTADCLPVLIGDTANGAMAAIHAGWRGTAGRITERTVADLMQGYGMNPRTSIAALGPAACAGCYEVGEDVIDRYRKEFGYWRNLLGDFKEGGKAHLNIQAANIQQLVFCGFPPEQIYVAPFCTMHQNDLFFSYRREGNGQPSLVGRLLSVIGRLE